MDQCLTYILKADLYYISLFFAFPSTLDCKIKPVNPKGNQSWIFIERTDTEAPILWPPDAKSSSEKTLMLGKTGSRRRLEAEDEIVGWHHQLDACEFEQVLGDAKGQGSLACCSPWGRRVRHDRATERQLLDQASQVAQMVKNLPAMQKTWVQPLGWEDPLAAHSNVLAWTIPWTEEPGWLTKSPLGCKELDVTQQLTLRFLIISGRFLGKYLSSSSWDNTLLSLTEFIILVPRGKFNFNMCR